MKLVESDARLGLRNHEFFHLDLIEQLLQHLRDDLGMTGDLYAFGSSMGGFGALPLP